MEPFKCQHCGSEMVRTVQSIYCSNPLCNHDPTAKSPRWENGLVLEAGILSLLLGFAFFAVSATLGISLVIISIVFLILSFDVKKQISTLLLKRKTANSQRIED